jgi:site-specific recombinase XerD
LITCFLRFSDWRDINLLGISDIQNFLEYLAVSRTVSSSTQKVALNALVFLFRKVMGRDVENILTYSRASSRQHIPTVLSPGEITQLPGEMTGRSKLMASLMYGTGMRVMECTRLRVQDIDFEYRQITVRESKGNKQRVVPLPEKLISLLHTHLANDKQPRCKQSGYCRCEFIRTKGLEGYSAPFVRMNSNLHDSHSKLWGIKP